MDDPSTCIASFIMESLPYNEFSEGGGGGGYTIASCACDRQLYSKFSVKILLFNNCLGERLPYSQLTGDRQQYSRLSIDILPFNQLSVGKVTI